jgi:spore coat protein H
MFDAQPAANLLTHYFAMNSTRLLLALVLVVAGCKSDPTPPPDADPGQATGGDAGGGGKAGAGGGKGGNGTGGKIDAGGGGGGVSPGGAGGGLGGTPAGGGAGGTAAGGGAGGAGGAGGMAMDTAPRDLGMEAAAGSDAAPPTDTAPSHAEAAAAFFKLTVVHKLELTVPPAEWSAFLAEHANTMLDPAWHQADMKLDGVALSKVGYKTFGFGSRLFAPSKPNINLDINKNTPGQTFGGLTRIRFKNNAQDASGMRQALVYEAMRAVGLGAPRSSFAEVFVNGESYGIYAAEEPFTSSFVFERTGNENGPAYEAFDCRGFVAPAAGGCPKLIENYSRPFNPLIGAGEDLTAMCNVMNGPAEQFIASITPLIDLNEWVTAVAADTAIAGNYDGFSTNGNNYRMYHDTATNKMHLYLFGPDVTFDPDYLPFPNPTKPAPGADCMMTYPSYRDIFLEKLLATPAGADMYKQAVKKLRAGVMAPAAIKARVDTIWALIGDRVKAEKRPAIEQPTAEISKERIKAYMDMRDSALAAAGL